LGHPEGYPRSTESPQILLALHLALFRGRKADLLKIVFWDGTGLCLFTKRLEQSRFFWPVADEATGSVMLTSAQLSMLIEGVDWRSPERRWRPSVAG
jgi:transposase